MLAKPNYIEFNSGQIEKIFCQVCGIQIAGMTEAPAGPGPNIHKIVSKFKRFHNYSEAKFKCDDGSFHVTNGCIKCFMSLNPVVAQEIIEADGMANGRHVIAVVAVDNSGSGLI